jgi:hypothetical protein
MTDTKKLLVDFALALKMLRKPRRTRQQYPERFELFAIACKNIINVWKMFHTKQHDRLTKFELYWLRRIQNRLRHGARLTKKDKKYYREIEDLLKENESSKETMDHTLVLTFALREQRLQDDVSEYRDLRGNETDDQTPPYTGDYCETRKSSEKYLVSGSEEEEEDDEFFAELFFE